MSSSSSPTWQLSRLRRDTVNKLKDLAKRLDRARDRGMIGDCYGADGWTVDAIVQWLLEQDANHLERARKASQRRADRRRSIDNGRKIPGSEACDMLKQCAESSLPERNQENPGGTPKTDSVGLGGTTPSIKGGGKPIPTNCL